MQSAYERGKVKMNPVRGCGHNIMYPAYTVKETNFIYHNNFLQSVLIATCLTGAMRIQRRIALSQREHRVLSMFRLRSRSSSRQAWRGVGDYTLSDKLDYAVGVRATSNTCSSLTSGLDTRSRPQAALRSRESRSNPTRRTPPSR